MSEKGEPITQKWIELAETFSREYLRKRNEEVLRFLGVDPDGELPDNDNPVVWYPAEEYQNTRIYWIEINSGTWQGTRCWAWRTGVDPDFPWVTDLPTTQKTDEPSHEVFADDDVTVIYEIPE